MRQAETQFPTTITLVQAPGIPESERKALEQHWKDAVLDPNYNVVLNYECRVALIDVRPGYNVLVQAPGLPTLEIRKLAKTVNKARKAKKLVDRVIVTNYECRIDVVSPA